jgi:hypothetical protein
MCWTCCSAVQNFGEEKQEINVQENINETESDDVNSTELQ